MNWKFSKKAKKAKEENSPINQDITKAEPAERTQPPTIATPNVQKIEKNHKLSYSTSYTMLDNIHAIVYVSDFETYEVIFANSFTQNIFGDIIGKKCWEVLREGNKGPCDLCPNKRLVDKNGQPKGVYIWEYFNNYNDRWYQAFDQAINWIDGRMVRFEIAYDLTEKKKDERRLFKYLKREKLFSDISSTLNKVGDYEGKINNILKMVGENDELTRVFIYQLDEEKNEFSLTFEWKAPDVECKKTNFTGDMAQMIEILEKKGIIRSDQLSKISNLEIINFFKESEVKSFMVVPLYDDDKLIGFIGCDDFKDDRKWQEMDITGIKSISNLISNAYQRRRIEQEIIDNEKNLRIANTTKDKFFSIIGHDLKNPFSSIMGFSDLIAKNFNDYSSERIIDFLNIINISAKNIYQLLDNLLNWSRSQTNELQYKPQNIEINKIITDNINLFEASIFKKNLSLNIQLEKVETIYADMQMINTVLRNVISNAIKFTPHNGEISIFSKTNKNFLEISVIDTGVGISKKKIKNIFTIDYSSVTEGTDGEKGSGLGLFLSKEFIEKNGGEISIKSKLNKGTSFTFTIPINKMD